MTAMNQVAEKPIKAYLALSAGALILGFSAIFVRLANAPGTVVAFYRMAIGTLVLAVPFFQRLRSGATFSRSGAVYAVLAGIFFGLDLAAWTSGIMLRGATIPTLFANTAPLWVGLGALIIFREKLGGRFWLGLALALVGASIVLGFNPDQRFEMDPGAMLGLIAGLFYGAYFLAAQRGREHLDALIFFWPAALTSSLLLLVFNLVANQPMLGFTSATWLNLLAQGILIQAGGWLLISYSQGHLPASLVSPTLLAQPLLTALLAGPILGEIFSNRDVLGGLVLLLGILFVHLSRRPRRSVLPTQ